LKSEVSYQQYIILWENSVGCNLTNERGSSYVQTRLLLDKSNGKVSMVEESMTGVTELGYVRFGVSDIDTWRDLMGQTLGFEIRHDMNDDKLWLRMDNWHHRICIEKNDCDDLTAMGLRVAGREEFRAIQDKLTAAKVPFEIGSQEFAIERWVIEIMTFEDPAGIPIELFHGPHLDPHLPFYPARRRHGKFVTGAAGMGHLLINHGGVEESYEFYKMLGFRGASEFRVVIPGAPAPIAGVFMHTNVPGGREHTIAFGLPEKKHCNHLMVEVDNIEDLMVSYQLVKEKGYPIVLDLGRHANDDAFSFYFKTPAGFAIEVSYGCCGISEQSYMLRDDYFGHEPNPDLPAHMGEVDEVRKK